MIVANPEWQKVVSFLEDGVLQWNGGLKPHPENVGKPMTDLETMLLFQFGYFATVVIGSFLMSFKEKPFKLYYIKLVHNFILFALSGYMCVETIRQAISGGYTLFGNSLETGKEPHVSGMANIIWIFYVSKAYEFVDTLIMILGKKHQQVSVLHVYHHGSIFPVWWAIAVYAPGGAQGYTFVQPIKPYITMMQMTQFLCMLIQSLYDYIFPPQYPLCLIKLLGWYMLTLLALFGNFFVQSYMKKGKKQKQL